MIRFCTHCGSPVRIGIPDGDNRARHICDHCGHIHYENPRLIVGCVAEWEGRILLCRRAIEPRLGYWTLPAGFMENGETTAQAAIRETQEEAEAEVRLEALYALFSIAHINQIHLFYRGRMSADSHGAGEESLETRLFMIEELPWESLSFPSVELCLRRYVEDRQHGRFGFHEAEIAPTNLNLQSQTQKNKAL